MIINQIFSITYSTNKKKKCGAKKYHIELFTKKNDRWFEIQKRQLALQEHQKELDLRRFELEYKEKTKRLEMEEEKEKMLKDFLKNQQKLLEVILKKISPDDLYNKFFS